MPFNFDSMFNREPRQEGSANTTLKANNCPKAKTFSEALGMISDGEGAGQKEYDWIRTNQDEAKRILKPWVKTKEVYFYFPGAKKTIGDSWSIPALMWNGKEFKDAGYMDEREANGPYSWPKELCRMVTGKIITNEKDTTSNPQ